MVSLSKAGIFRSIRRVWCCCVLLLVQPLQAGVQMTLDRDSISVGETVVLTINRSGREAGGDPDLTGLQQDFEILGTRTSQQVQIFNGQRSDKRQWHIELAPKHAGMIKVPSIRIGGLNTQALLLTVAEEPENVTAGSGQALFINTRMKPVDAPVYVQQQIHYMVQLYFREPLAEGNFVGPDIEGAIIERLGDDRRFNTTFKGQTYQVIERHFAVFPEQSGVLKIPPVVFNGRLVSVAAPRLPGRGSMLERFFGGSVINTPGKRVRVRSEELKIDILPRPDAYTGQHWLPSEKIILSDSWTKMPPEVRAGEPVMRTITLEAKGLEASHLPALALAGSRGVRLYPEQPVYETRTDGDWVYGSRVQSVAYVPTAAGMMTVPAIRIDWWNTREQRQESTVLPAWDIHVLPGVVSGDQPPLPEGSGVADHEGDTPGTKLPVEETISLRLSGWQRYGIWLLAGLLLSGMFLVLRRLSRVQKRRVGKVRQRLEQACRSNDAPQAAHALLEWAAARWPTDTPRNLGTLAERLDTGCLAVRQLDQALYGTDRSVWQGEYLLNTLSQEVAGDVNPAAAGQGGLSPLYPGSVQGGSE